MERDLLEFIIELTMEEKRYKLSSAIMREKLLLNVQEQMRI